MDNFAPVGHIKQREQMHRLLQDEKLHTTLLFTGIEGIGKKLSAFELSRAMLCEAPRESRKQGGCGVCKSCVLCLTGQHPDRHLVEAANKEDWNLDAVRDLLYSLSLKPFQGSQRVVIFNDAESLSLQASNVLLKTLEEPRPGNWFILITSNPSKLLITLRSRCQVWSFAPLEPEALSKIVERLNPGDRGALSTNDIAELSDGSVRVAQLLIDEGAAAQDVRTLLKVLIEGGATRAFEVSAEWGKDRANLRQNLALCRVFARRMLLDAQGSDLQSRWATFLTNVLAAEHAIFDRNISAQLVLQQMFSPLLPTGVLGSFTASPNNATLLDTLRL